MRYASSSSCFCCNFAEQPIRQETGRRLDAALRRRRCWNMDAIWALERSWWKAVDYRRWLTPLTAPFFLLAAIEACLYRPIKAGNRACFAGRNAPIAGNWRSWSPRHLPWSLACKAQSGPRGDRHADGRGREERFVISANDLPFIPERRSITGAAATL